MIKKTLIFFIIFLIIHILIRDVYKPDILLSQAQWQGNQVMAQDYLYSDKYNGIENIIVGSSMASRLIMDSLNYLNFYNLAFGGGSPNEGFSVIKSKGIFPKRIFVEINLMNKVKNNDFYDVLYNPVLYPLRKEIPAFRDGKQPLPLAIGLFDAYILTPVLPHRFSFFDRFKKEEGNEEKKINLAENEDTKDVIEAAFDTSMAAFAETQEYIADFEKNGTEIIFFEMPTDKTNCKEEGIPQYRILTEKNYPPNKYHYIPTPPCGSYTTSDGIHLGGGEIERYTHYFITQIDSLIRPERNK